MSSSPSPAIEAERRAWSYWFLDGLPELVSGGSCLLAAFLIYLVTAGGPGRREVQLLGALGILLLMLFVIGMRKILEWLKARITYPRTGYAAAPYFTEPAHPPPGITTLGLARDDPQREEAFQRYRAGRSRRFRLYPVMYMLVWWTALLIENRWGTLTIGLAAGIGFWLVARKDQHLSWLVLVGFPVMGMLFFAVSSVRNERAAFFLAGAGIVFLVDGALKLLRYLRQHPVATP